MRLRSEKAANVNKSSEGAARVAREVHEVVSAAAGRRRGGGVQGRSRSGAETARAQLLGFRFVPACYS